MSGVTIGFLMGGLVLVLLVIRVHIAVAMLLAGGIGYALVAGIDPLFNYAKTMAFARYSADCRGGCARPRMPFWAITGAVWP